ncbi:tetratricopeptide repeat-containing sulfotransferase family protein [Taklimakanibacter lacteus]|uniref:tetratricopeptide repeat-containing sulfotransferase family protein n=1 Tax=Taklimakanibacter lacteus TaxID=2268456 RepID=UPI000E669144
MKLDLKPTKAGIAETLARGLAFYRQKRFTEAEYCYQLVLRQFPNHPQALNFLGMLAVEAKRLDEAIRLLGLAVRHAPKDATIRNNLGNVFLLDDQYDKAAVNFRKALALDPKLIPTLVSLGKAYRKLGKGEEARQTFERALALSPQSVEAELGLAETLVEIGELPQAETRFRTFLSREPGNARALLGYAVSHKFTASEPEVAAIEKLLAEAPEKQASPVTLHHAAGKMFHDLKRHDEAFFEFKASKDASQVQYDLKAYREFVDRMIATFDKAFFASRMGFGHSSEIPVFVVGMPRSGTTLTEQILASHPLIWGAGERSDFNEILKDLGFDALRSPNFPQSIRAVAPKSIRELASRYVADISRGARDARRVVNKLPHNFEYLGLIALTFPKAKIVHCRRDPMDNCLSCFMQTFNEAHAYNRDLETLGLYYREYHRLMRHWKSVLPLEVFELPYEEMVAEQEAMSRSLIAFTGLEWDDACLAFHDTDRSVSTPSRWQVRQPIYRSSVKAWRAYEKHLGPLKDALGDLAVG